MTGTCSTILDLPAVRPSLINLSTQNNADRLDMALLEALLQVVPANQMHPKNKKAFVQAGKKKNATPGPLHGDP